MVTNSNIYLYSLIARAAYKDFKKDPTGNYNNADFVNALKDTKAGMFTFQSSVMINDLTSKVTVIYQYTSLTGFSATVFQDMDGKYIISFRGTEPSLLTPADLIADALIGTVGVAGAQILALNTFINKLYASDGAGLYAGTMFDVVGDSLGGHLAEAFLAQQFNHVNDALIFESPGISETYLALYGISANQWSSKIQHIYGEAGTELISGNSSSLLSIVGSDIIVTPQDSQGIFIEDKFNLNPLQLNFNHGMGPINSSLGVYDLFPYVRLKPPSFRRADFISSHVVCL